MLRRWLRGRRIVGDPKRRGGAASAIQGTLATALFVLVAALLVIAAGATAACAVLTSRGHNPARIALAGLMGVFAAVNGLNLLDVARGGGLWDGPGLALVLFALSMAVLSLLLNRGVRAYFSPGPGRRFTPGG